MRKLNLITYITTANFLVFKKYETNFQYLVIFQFFGALLLLIFNFSRKLSPSKTLSPT